MKKNLKIAAMLLGAVAALVVVLLLAAPASAAAASTGQVIVELRNSSTSEPTRASSFSSQRISGTDNVTKQEYKFQRQREGKNFTYTIANLSASTSYRVEMSFVEHDHSTAGSRLFNTYVQGGLVLSKLDVFTRAGGKDRAYQRTFTTTSNSSGRITVQLRSDQAGCRDYATVSTVRVYRGSTNAVEISGAASRNKMSMPVRFTNSSSQDAFEALLARMGSRLSLDLVPQRLGARFSALGTATGDLSDLVMLLQDGSKYRALPFTDRYPVWESISQSQTLTQQTFTCSSSATPFKVTVRFRAPFYPENQKVSGAPFVYADVTVRNSGSSARSGSFVFALPSRQDFTSSSVAEFTTAGGVSSGVRYSTKYNYYDDSISNYRPKSAVESLAVPGGEATDVDFRGSAQGEFSDFSASKLWGRTSPSGYPKTYSDANSPLFSFYPRGYVGAVWTINNLAPNASMTKHFVLSGYCSDKVLKVKNRSFYDQSFRFSYRTLFSSYDKVVDYAVSSRWAGDNIQALCDFFDNTVSSNSYLSLQSAYRYDLRNLMACSFQSFLANTWLVHSDLGRDWFSVWEGTTCRFHSTIDVEYNNAWFYIHFWPGLLKTLLDEWPMYRQSSSQGTFLSHDMGWNDEVVGMAYPLNMAVEENANYILLLYKYWRTTGNTGYLRTRFSTARSLADFMINCDTNNNGLPDLYTQNTIDQGSPALQRSRDQAYLGVKCLASYRAMTEMAGAVGSTQYQARYQGQVEMINQTLEQDLWLSDHFAVSLDGGVANADREAYHIYTANGLVYPLGSRRNVGVTSDNLSRMGTDARVAADRTLKQFGCTHSTYDAYNQWASQGMWRDQAACQLGVSLNGANPLAMSSRYWDMQKYFARNMNGGFWDVVVYPGGSGPKGASAEVHGGPLITNSDRSGGASGYVQDLGYYPRGTACFGLIDSVAGLVIDVPGGSMYYQPNYYPMRVPVFSRADWDNPDPSKRVPVLHFTSKGRAPSVTNPGRLPAKRGYQNNLDVGSVTGPAHALSPNGDPVNAVAQVTYDLPKPSTVQCSIWEGAVKVRTLPAESGSGKKTLRWDGKTSSGQPAPDGIYTARMDAQSTSSTYSIRPASSQVFVNSSIPDLSREWYLAEGFTGVNATGGDFEQYVLIQNPNASAATVNVTFMLPGGETVERRFSVAPNSRFTITVDSILPNHEVSTHLSADVPVAVERAMYFSGRRAGHDSIGVTRPGEKWYLAEGYTAQNFDEYVLVQNPGSKEATIKATFMTPGAGNMTRSFKVEAHARFTIHVDDYLPNHEVSTMIESTEPVVVERAQYLNSMTAGTCSIAAASLSRTWYLAEGYTDQGFEEYVLVQNPNDDYNDITVTFMEKSGANTIRNYMLPPNCRFTIGVDGVLKRSEVSVKVRSQLPVMVERAMYFNNRSDGHACIGTPTPDTEWYLAEGYTAGGFETWVLVQNPGDTVANVTLTMMENSGNNTTRTYQVQPRSRFTVSLDEILPSHEVSTRVSADAPVIVERAIYFNNRSGGTCSPGVRGY